MKYRMLGATELEVSEVGFGVWTVSTNWGGFIKKDEGTALLRRALDLGVSLFDTADSYSDGYGEQILAVAFGKSRHDVVIATKFGYDFYANVFTEGRKERPQNFSPEFVPYACEQSLKRLGTDYIDLYQVHDPRIDAIEQDELFYTLETLVSEGKIRYYGVALGPDIGWFEEGEASMRERNVASLQTIYNILEQDPAVRFFPIAEEKGTGLLTRAPHAWGLLDGTYTRDTVFDPADTRTHLKREWLEQRLEKLARLDFLVDGMGSTMAQTAIKFALAAPQVATVLPNITNMEQMEEFVAASESEEIPQEFLDRITEVYEEDFYSEPAAGAAGAN